jgi:hypothetical protein
VFRLYLYARVRFSMCFCTRDRGCSVHPAFPAPFVFEGKGSGKTSGASRCEKANVCVPGDLSTIAQRAKAGGRGPSIPEASVMESISRSVLDRPAFAKHDSFAVWIRRVVALSFSQIARRFQSS